MVDLFLLVHPISFLFLDIMPPPRSGLLLAPAGCLLLRALSGFMQGSTLLVLLLGFRLRSIFQSYALLGLVWMSAVCVGTCHSGECAANAADVDPDLLSFSQLHLFLACLLLA